MSRAPSSDSITTGLNLKDTVVDSLGFAREGRELAGQLAVADLPRLQDLVKEYSGCLQVKLQADKDLQGRPWLHLHVSGTLLLECQRCLEGLVHPLAIEAHMRLIAPGDPWPEDELEAGSEVEADDAIEASSVLSVRDLVEEEIILGLPYAPTHDVCFAPGATEANTLASPFAGLAVLKKH